MVAMFATVHHRKHELREASSFEAPKNLESLIESTREKVFSVSCDNSQGTAWPLQLVEQTVLVTNVHVIKECVASAGNIHVENPISRIQVRVLGIDENTDELQYLRILLMSKAFLSSNQYPSALGLWL